MRGPLPEPEPNLVVIAWVAGELGNYFVKAYCSQVRGNAWAFGDHFPLERIGTVRFYAILRNEPATGYVPLAEHDDDPALMEVLEKLRDEGGCLVHVADCSEGEISAARARGDYVHNYDRGLKNGGFVRRLPSWVQQHSTFARGASLDGCGR